MNLELIKKLTALANNNPNENEANLAARKVCKLLAEAKFNLGVNTNPPKREPPRTWQDVRRSTEPEFSSRPPTGPGGDFRSASNHFESNPFYEWFTKGPRSRDPYGEPWVRPPEPEPKQEPSQSTYKQGRPFNPFADFNIDLDDLIGKHINVKIPRQEPKGYKESKIRTSVFNGFVEVTCIKCNRWYKIAESIFAEAKGCYVCDECRGK